MPAPLTENTPPLSMIWMKMINTRNGVAWLMVLTRDDAAKPRVMEAIANTATPISNSTNGKLVSNDPVGGSGRNASPMTATMSACTTEMTPSTISLDAR